VRAFDPDVIIFFAGIVWGKPGFGFSAPPGGVEFANRSVLVVRTVSWDLALSLLCPPRLRANRSVHVVHCRV
jgi:hypothetical protein